MLSPTLGLRASLVLVSCLVVSPSAEAQVRVSAPETKSPKFWQAAGAIAAVNGLTWFYNWHIQRWAWANVGTESWWANLRGGFAWDDDAFGANQVAHPYHGGLYFNAARGSGYDFWSSTPFVAAGSLSWELFTENVRPSLNDLINTTLGGIALGEVAYRMSGLLTSSSGRSVGRQLGAFLVSPVGQAQSFIDGRADHSAPSPQAASTLIAIGQRRGAAGPAAGPANGRPFVGLTVQYGSAFSEQFSRPYDAFEFSLHLSPNEHVVLTHAAVSGLLTRSHILRSERSQLLFGLYQHYDYDDLPLTKASSQSVSGALLYRGTPGTRTEVDFGVHLEVLPIAAISSDYEMVRRRDYDFGAGVGGRVTGALRHAGRELVRVEGRSVWIRTLYGADANHHMTTANIRAAIPVFRPLSLGADLSVTLRRSSYLNQFPVSRRLPQLRAYLIWSRS